MNPIGYMKSPFLFKNGTPRQATVCSQARGVITIEKSVFNNPEHSLEGLEDFTHVWILFIFHQNNNTYTKAKVKPPRLNGKRVGLFSTRSPYRPNNVGLTLAKIESISGATLTVSGIDILDGTPVIDIKPYIPQYDCPSTIAARNSMQTIGDAGMTKDDLHDDDAISFVDNHDPNSVSEDLVTDSELNRVFVGERSASKMCNVARSNHGDSVVRDDVAMERRLDGVDQSENKVIDNKIDCGVIKSGQAVPINQDILATSKGSPKTLDEKLSVVKESVAIRTRVGEGDELKSNAIEDFSPTTGAIKLKSDMMKHSGSVTSVDNKVEDEVLGNSKHDSTENSERKVSRVHKQDSDVTNAESEVLDGGKPNSDIANFVNEALAVGIHERDNASPVSRAAQWIETPPIHSLSVRFTPSALKQLEKFSVNSQSNDMFRLNLLKSSKDAKDAICNILSADPRSTYRRKNCLDSLYYFTIDTLHVTCWFDECIAEVVRVKPACVVDQCKHKYT